MTKLSSSSVDSETFESTQPLAKLFAAACVMPYLYIQLTISLLQAS